MQIVMSAAGKGERFKNFVDIPKPMIMLGDKPMWVRAIEPWLKYCKPVVVFHKSMQPYLKDPGFDFEVMWVTTHTEGAAHTAFHGVHHKSISMDKPVCFVECDSAIHFDHDNWRTDLGGTFVVERDNPAHSYTKIDDQGYIIEIKEKEVISPWANTGHYWWQTARQFKNVFTDAWNRKDKTKGEYYNAPLYNDAIANGDKFTTQVVDKWDCWGTPDDVVRWLDENSNMH